MMAAFNTLPAEEEPLVEKATKTKTLWRRLACSAAVTSLVLGAVAGWAAATPTTIELDGGGCAEDINPRGTDLMCDEDGDYYADKQSFMQAIA